MNCAILGIPVQSGTDQKGCLMGPDACRTAGLLEVLSDLGHNVFDHGNINQPEAENQDHPNQAIRDLGQTKAWIDTLQSKAHSIAQTSDFPIFIGGDHSLSAGTIPAVAKRARELDQQQYVLWLDAHPDLHTLRTTQSGNLHGTPVAFFTGQPHFASYYPELAAEVPAENICMMGIRSVDPSEKDLIKSLPIEVHDMRAIDETGVKQPLEAFLDRVRSSNGRLHVSFDVDFLDPDIALAVGTTVPGGATFREAHLIMELLHESRLVTSLDLVELNPFLDERGKTARLIVDLCGSLMGRKVLDKPSLRH